MGACRNDELGFLKVIRQTLALLPRQNILKFGHVLLALMFNMLVEVRHEGLEQGEEVLVIRGQILELVEILLHLVFVYQS